MLRLEWWRQGQALSSRCSPSSAASSFKAQMRWTSSERPQIRSNNLLPIYLSSPSYHRWPVRPMRRLRREVFVTGADRGDCGTWQRDYAALHADILAGRAPKRYALVYGQRGLADSLKGVLIEMCFAKRPYAGSAIWRRLTGDTSERPPPDRASSMRFAGTCSPHLQARSQSSGTRC